MRTVLNILFALFVFGTAFTAAPAEAHAAEPITIDVRTIAASTSGEGFDSRLDPLKSQLTRAFRGYTNFKLEGKRTFRLREGKSKAVPLPNGSELTLTNHGPAGDLVKIGLSLAGKMNTMLRVSRGGTFFQAGMNFGDGILIIAITVY